MGDRVEVDGRSGPSGRGHRHRLVTALLIVAIASTALILAQRPQLVAERTREQAVTISEEFIEEYAKGNHGAVMSLVSRTAEISMTPARNPQDLEMSMAWMEAIGWVITADRCTASARITGDGTQRVLCHLTQETAWSRVLELGPDKRSALTLEIASGRIVGAYLSFAPMSFRNDESVASFETWLSDNHPEDQRRMYRYAGLPSLTPQSIELWRLYTGEFVAEQSS